MKGIVWQGRWCRPVPVPRIPASSAAPARCRLRDTELFAPHDVRTLFHAFCSQRCPSQCGTAKRGPCGLRVTVTGTLSPGSPGCAGGAAATAGRAGAALLLCCLRYTEIDAGYWEFLSPQCFLSAPENQLQPGFITWQINTSAGLFGSLFIRKE